MGVPSTDEFEHLRDHVSYEIWMLSRALCLSEIIVDGSAAELEHAKLNAYIESFCTHARGLIEFFTKTSSKLLSAKRFAVASYSPLDQQTLEAFTPKLNMQIAHMIHHGRSSNRDDKIDGQVRRQMALALKAEVSHFKKHLRPEFISVGLPDVELFV